MERSRRSGQVDPRVFGIGLVSIGRANPSLSIEQGSVSSTTAKGSHPFAHESETGDWVFRGALVSFHVQTAGNVYHMGVWHVTFLFPQQNQRRVETHVSTSPSFPQSCPTKEQLSRPKSPRLNGGGRYSQPLFTASSRKHLTCPYQQSPRFARVKRPYTAEQVVSKRGSIPISYPSDILAKKLWHIFSRHAENSTPSHTYGA
jgi:hypothetical protein